VSGDERLARLRWRCRRGMLELDLALRYARLSEAERELLEQLLTVPDWELLGYLHGDSEPRDEEVRRLVRKIR
jgi:antitoxin CptB